jgi:esterase/lipase
MLSIATLSGRNLEKNMSIKRVNFLNRDGIKIVGFLDIPENIVIKAYSIFSNCFTCTQYYKAPVYVSRYLRERGIATLRFDFPGLGLSGGDFLNTTPTMNVYDIISATEFLTENYEAPKILIGHSMGGVSSILASSKIDSVEMVATIGTPSDPRRLGKRMSLAKAETVKNGEAHFEINKKTFGLKRYFFDDLEKYDTLKTVSELGKKLLIVHSPEDEIVPYKYAEEMYQIAKNPKKLLILSGCDHLVTEEKYAEIIAENILQMYEY